MTNPPPRLDPRVARTRRLLRQALIELMEEQDFEQVTVQDIADRATVKRATFYLHYPDKQALVQSCIDEVLGELRAAVDFPPIGTGDFDFASGKPHPVFVRLFRHVAEHFRLYHAMLVRNRLLAFSDGLLAVLHAFVSEGVRQTEPDDRNLTARREVVIKYVESAFLEVIVWWIAEMMPDSEEEIAAQLMNLSIRGPYWRNPVERDSEADPH